MSQRYKHAYFGRFSTCKGGFTGIGWKPPPPPHIRPSTADPCIHETPNLDPDAEFPDAEFRFSQLMYH